MSYVINKKQAPLNKEVKPYRRYSNDSTTFDWSKLDYKGVLDSITGMFSNIFGKGDKYAAMAYQKMYDQQKQTNVILWVVIGLVVALGVVLIVRKTH